MQLKAFFLLKGIGSASSALTSLMEIHKFCLVMGALEIKSLRPIIAGFKICLIDGIDYRWLCRIVEIKPSPPLSAWISAKASLVKGPVAMTVMASSGISCGFLHEWSSIKIYWSPTLLPSEKTFLSTRLEHLHLSGSPLLTLRWLSPTVGLSLSRSPTALVADLL